MTPTDVRAHLAINNYVPVPCVGKAPVLKKWQTRDETSEGDLETWVKLYPDARNTGILCAYTPTLDIDVLDERAVDAAVELVRERFGDRGKVMLRSGLRPKVAILFRTDVPFKKIRAVLTASDGSNGQKIEFLCEDQQVIVHGIHPDTRAPYQWSGGDPSHVKRDELPPITAAEASALVHDIAALMPNHGYQVADEHKRKPRGNGRDNDGNRVDWGHLYENIRTGGDYYDTLRDLSCKMVAAGTAPGAVVNILRDLMERSEAPHDERWQARYADIPRLVDGAIELLRQATNGSSPADPDAELARLAGLPLLEFEKQRKLAAEELGIRASMLDRLVAAKRAELGLDDGTDKQGKPVTFPEIEPWPETVDGAALLNELDEAFARHVIMPEAARTISAVWSVHTHLFDRFVVTPRLCIRSAVKDSGKTTYFSVLSHLVPKVLMAASATPSSVFRILATYRPVLLIDEAAGMFDEAGELRRILNAGYRFDGHVLRSVSVGDDFEPRLFDVFAPVAFALIGKLPSDLHSRCICVNLQRKLASERVEPYRIGQMHHLDVLVKKITRWTSDNADAIVQAAPALPPNVTNRSGDLWAVMLSIAAVAGGDWPSRVEQAIVASIEAGDDDSALFEKLITDIRTVFGEKEAVSSAELIEALVDMEGRPWPEFGRSRKPLTQAGLARMLRGPGFCITPYQIKFSRSGTWIQLRGYAKWQFADLFARYGSVYPPPKCQSVTNADGAGTSGVTLSDFAKAASVKVSPNPMPPVTPLTPGDTHGDTLKNSRNPDGTGAGDTLTPSEGVERAKGIEEPTLPGMLDPARVRQLVDWYRKQAKALRAEMSPGTLQVHLKQQLRETLAEELVADLVDDTANRIAKAATTRRRKQGAAP